MQFTAEHLTRSVIAVPPLARDARRNICGPENAKIIQHLQTNGIRSLLYGGNALLYQIGMHEYTGLLSLLNNTASSDTMVVPSIGPTYGMAMEQLAAFDDFDFPTVMLLPSRDAVNQRGVANAIADFANRFGGPIVVYIKHDRWLDAALIRSLEAAGAISWIKYAVVRDQPQDDDYLREILDIFPADRMVSGIGEQPAIDATAAGNSNQGLCSGRIDPSLVPSTGGSTQRDQPDACAARGR
jgi:dihydrodipicolinate synthase/N-acetylneuraminate lyase